MWRSACSSLAAFAHNGVSRCTICIIFNLCVDRSEFLSFKVEACLAAMKSDKVKEALKEVKKIYLVFANKILSGRWLRKLWTGELLVLQQCTSPRRGGRRRCSGARTGGKALLLLILWHLNLNGENFLISGLIWLLIASTSSGMVLILASEAIELQE